MSEREAWPQREPDSASAPQPVAPAPAEAEPAEPEPEPEEAAAEQPVRAERGPGEGVPGEPGGSPAQPEPARREAAVADAPEAAAEAAPEPTPEPAPEPAPAEHEPDSLEHVGGVFQVPEGYTVLEGEPFGGRRTVGVVVARFNRDITKALLESALDALAAAGVSKNAITVMPVPGAFELPLAAMALAKTRRYACVVALGCVIRGETPHFDFVAGEAASGLQLAAIETGVPVSFGVLTCETREQAEARVDRGGEAARTALEMADVFAQLRAAAAAG